MKISARPVQIISWLLAVLLAAWIIWQLPVGGVSSTLSAITFGQWFIWAGVNLSIILVYVLRWQYLCRATGYRPGFLSLLGIRQAGQVVSFITPGPQFGGEPLQVYWLWKKSGVPPHLAVLDLGLDRFYELWINFAVLLLGILLVFTSQLVAEIDWWYICLLLFLLLGLLSFIGGFLVINPGKIQQVIRRLTDRWRHHPLLKTFDTHWDRLSEALQFAVAKSRRELLKAVLLSLLGWVGMIIEIWLIFDFVGVMPALSGFILVLVAMRLAFLLPLPGGVGTLEAAVFWSFHILEIPVEAAAGFIALMRIRDVVILACGFTAMGVIQGRRNLEPDLR